MSRYPSESVARFDQQFAETTGERNARLRKQRRAKSAATITVRCVACKGTREIDFASPGAREQPMCKSCFMPMVAESARA